MLTIEDINAMSVKNYFHDEWLNPEEQEQLAGFKLSKRQKEWLTARICAKMAVQDFCFQQLQLTPNRVTVVNDKNGRPQLFYDGTLLADVEISISHSGAFALVLIAKKNCGIDIQENRDTLLRVKDRFCTKTDETCLADAFTITPEVKELNLLWTVKEAIRKSLSHDHLPHFLKIHLDQVDRLDGDTYTFHCHYQQRQISVVCAHHQNYSIGFTTLEE